MEGGASKFGYKIWIVGLIFLIVFFGLSWYLISHFNKIKSLFVPSDIKTDEVVEVKRVEYDTPPLSEITQDKFAVAIDITSGSYKALKYPDGNTEYYYMGEIIAVRAKENAIYEVTFRSLDSDKNEVFEIPKYPPVNNSKMYGMDIKEVYDNGFKNISFVVNYAKDGQFWGWDIFTQINKVKDEN